METGLKVIKNTHKISETVENRLIFIFLALVIGTVYILTMLPGVGYAGDTAKFQLLSKILGIPHPTGYPTYIMLSHVFTKFFPFGTQAYKANLLSGLFTIIGSFFFYRLLLNFGVEKFISTAMTLTLAFTPTIWSQSVIAEVYTLNLLFVLSVLYFFILWHNSKSEIYFYLACFIYALSFGNHLTMITFFPAVVFIVYITDRKSFTDVRKIIFVLLIITIGALQYSYLFWRSYNIGSGYLEARIPDFKTFWWFVTGGDFKKSMFSIPLTTVLTKNIPYFFECFFRQFLFLIPIGFYGIYKLKNRLINAFLLIGAAGLIAYSINYKIIDIFVYYIPVYIIFGIYLGIGFQNLLQTFQKNRVLIRTAVVFIPVLFLIINVSAVNQHYETSDASRIENLLKKVEKDSLIISSYTDAQYIRYYLIENNYRSKNIYVIHDFKMDTIKAYLVNANPIMLQGEGITVPPGLKVYITDPKKAAEMINSGFKLMKQNGLARITK